jgi:outer membrane protein
MQRAGLKSRLLAGAFSALLLTSQAAWSETLAGALSKAYENSPVLESGRAALRAQDETIPQAKAAMKPMISAIALGTFQANTAQNLVLGDTWRAQLVGSLLLFDSGQTPAAVASAEAADMASRSLLTELEQGVLLDAATAYLDVRRDMELVNLNINNVSVLEKELQSVNDRFSVGEVTRTDVAQTEARLALANATLATAEGALAVSSNTYLAAVGAPATDLAPPPPIPDLANSVSAAQAVAMQEHPAVVAARFSQDASQYDVERAVGASGLSVSLEGRTGVAVNEVIDGSTIGAVEVTLSGQIPLYQGGTLESLVRQAEAVLAQRRFELQNTARIIQQNVAIAWAYLEISRAQIVAIKQQIAASEIALEGVKVEASLGARTTLDELNAAQELLFAQSNLVTAQRDEYVAAFNLLASMGLLTVKYLNLGIPTYNPEINLQAVENGPINGFDGAVLDRIGHRWGN